MSEIRDLCRKTYQEWVNGGAYPAELKRALRAHERVPLFIDNLAKEFTTMKFKVKKEQIISAVRDLTRVFISNVIREAEERALSPLKIAMMKAEQSRKDEMSRLADAVNRLGDQNEKIIQDSAGNKTSRATINLDQL